MTPIDLSRWLDYTVPDVAVKQPLLQRGFRTVGRNININALIWVQNLQLRWRGHGVISLRQPKPAHSFDVL